MKKTGKPESLPVPPGTGLYALESGDFGRFGEFFLGVHLHFPEGHDGADADVEVAAGEDQEEGEAGDAALGLPRPEAAEVPDANPDAGGHVAAEGDLDDWQR